jgi:hypothetical protein
MRVVVFKLLPKGSIFLADIDTGDAMQITNKSAHSLRLYGSSWPRVNNHSTELADLKDSWADIEPGQHLELHDQLRKMTNEVIVIAKFELLEDPLASLADVERGTDE